MRKVWPLYVFGWGCFVAASLYAEAVALAMILSGIGALLLAVFVIMGDSFYDR